MQDAKKIQDELLDLGPYDVFVVNNQYKCRFDFKTTIGSAHSMFTRWQNSENCKSRKECYAFVNVYDLDNGVYKLGKIEIAINNDLVDSCKYAVSLSIKDLGIDNWSNTLLVHSIEDNKKEG